MKIVLYTTHCPKCNVLQKKMKQKNISYKEVNDIETIKEKGFTTVPMLDVDGTIMDFISANEWLNSLEGVSGY